MINQRPKHRHRRHGFTLVELLVVMAIMVVLMGLVLVVVMHTLKSGRKSRLQADMQTISLGLEAYKDNFSDYPRLPNISSSPGGQWDLSSQRGAELLCRALIGPGPAFAPSNISPGSKDNSGADGAGAGGSGDPSDANSKVAGPGFRTRSAVDSSGNPLGAQGRVWGPYLSPDKFRVVSLSTFPNITTVIIPAAPAGTIDATAVMLDSENHVILYFPACTSSPTISSPGGFEINSVPAAAPFSPLPLYNFYDNATVPSDPTSSMPFAPTTNDPSWFADFAKILGDTSTPANNQIDAGETPSYTGPYLLWFAGEDGMYGLDKKPNVAGGVDFSGTGKSDDVTNFDIPANLRK